MLSVDNLPEPSIAGWEARIRPHLEGAVEHIVAAGRELIDAKAALPHGQFGPLLDALGLTPRTAQRFMRIAEHPVLSDPTRVSHLPTAWSTLFELSRLDDADLVEAIEAGIVKPGLDRKGAQALAAPVDDEAPMSVEEARAFTAEIRQSMWNIGRDVTRAVKLGLTGAALREFIEDLERTCPEPEGRLGLPTMGHYITTCVAVATIPEPDFSRPFEEQWPEPTVVS